MIATVNPATGELVKSFDPLSDAEVQDRVARAVTAFASYRLNPLHVRARSLQAAADLLDAEQEDIARLVTSEMGKTLAEARAEVSKCASIFRYYADNGASLL